MLNTPTFASTRTGMFPPTIANCETLEECEQELTALQESGESYGIVCVSIRNLDDALKDLSNQNAHQAIDVLSSRLANCVRNDDKAFKAKDDHYLVLIHGEDASEICRGMQDRIRLSMEEDIALDDNTIRVAVDFGYASCPEDGTTLDELIARACSDMHDSIRLARRAYELAGSSYIDSLTGLEDTRMFRMRASEMMEDEQLRAQGLSMVFCDIEEFKTYNLKYGYNAGDNLLRLLADKLSTIFEGDPVVRINSDRFCILTPTATAVERVEQAHDQLRESRANSNVELKAGIYNLGKDDHSISIAQDYARLACDSIKRRYDVSWRRFDDELDKLVRRRRYIVENLDTAIDQGWIEPYFQPIMRAVSGKVYALESLVRWNDPEHGILPPCDFIGVLEDARLIHKLDIHVVRLVCEQGQRIIEQTGHEVSFSINFSRLDYQLCDIFAIIDDIVVQTGFPRRLLRVELTESAFTEEALYLTEVIQKFRVAGYQIWMDDFGSGYSSLNLLKDFEFDVLKLDMGFLRGIEQSTRTRDIVLSIVDMAKKLGIQTLAEGVETEEQYNFLKSIGCELVQGFYFSKPVTLDEIIALLTSTLDIETSDEHAYFDQVGHVNLLSPAPFYTEGVHEPGMETDLVLPLAILERQGTDVTPLAYTTAFSDMLKESHFIDDQIRPTAQGQRILDEILKDTALLDDLDDVRNISIYDFEDLYTARIQCVATQDDRSAYLIMLDRHNGKQENTSAMGGTRTIVDADAVRDKIVYLPKSQNTAWQQSKKIDLKKTALLVIDVLGGSEGVVPGLEETAQRCVTLAKAARKANVPVVFSIDNHIPGLDRELELWGDHGVRGTQGAVVLDDFEVCDYDLIVPKRRYNGFFETDLELTLRELDVDTLIVVGYDTNICVLQTLAGAYYYGYKTIVPADATATFLVGTQEAGLEYFSRCYDTRVVDTAEVLKYFEG